MSTEISKLVRIEHGVYRDMTIVVRLPVDVDPNTFWDAIFLLEGGTPQSYEISEPYELREAIPIIDPFNLKED